MENTKEIDMNKKVFLVNNWVVVALFLVSIFTPINSQMMVFLVGVLLAIKGAQAIMYLLAYALKQYRLLFVVLVSVIMLSGTLVPVANLLIKGALFAVLGMEIFVHLGDGFLQYRQGKKTWMINIMIAVLFITFLLYSIFSWKSEFISNLLFFAISLNSIFYLLVYYIRGEFLGNFTLLNMNAALYRDAFIPKGEYMAFANADEKTLQTLIEKNQFGLKTPLPEDHVTIYLHTWKPTIDMMGHCDVSYKGKVYSFSNYDVEKMMFGGMASIGTIGVTSTKAYINFCTDEENKLLYGYTLKLSRDEAKQMDYFVEQLNENSHVWQPNDLSVNKAAKLIMEKTDCVIREVDRGAFRHYFVVGTNCVKLVDVMLNYIGIKTRVSSGLLTPGQYFKMFDQENNDRVVRKQVYWKDVNHENVV